MPDNNSSDYGHVSSAGVLQLDEHEGHVETYLPVPAASKTLAWLSTGLPDENSSGHSRDSSTDGRNGGRHGQLSLFLLGHVTCLHCPQASSRPQAICPAFHLTILSLLGCGLC